MQVFVSPIFTCPAVQEMLAELAVAAWEIMNKSDEQDRRRRQLEDN